MRRSPFPHSRPHILTHTRALFAGRLWALKFIVAKDHETRAGYQHMRAGSWVAVLSLLPHSPPTWIDSRLVIEDPRARTHPPPPPDPTGPPTSLREAVEGMLQYDAQPGSAKPKPKIELRMKRSEQLTAPPNMRYPNHSVIPVPFEENTLAHSLQFKCVHLLVVSPMCR